MSTTEHSTNAALEIGTKAVTRKYNVKEWEATEKKLSEFDQEVLKLMIASGEGEDYNFVVKPIKVMGDALYSLIRNSINVDTPDKKITLIIDEKRDDSSSKSSGGKKKKKKKGKGQKGALNKREQIRLNIAKDTVMSTVKSITSTFNTKKLTPYTAFRSDIIEIRAIGLMYALWYICAHTTRFGKDGSKSKHYPFVLDVIIAAEKFINECGEYEGLNMTNTLKTEKISPMMINDLRKLHATAKILYPYDGFTIYEHAPQLLVYSNYDKCNPNKILALRKNQKEVISFVKSNYKTGFLLSYKAMIASGKTTCSVALIAFMVHLRRQYPEFRNVEFIFCCNLDTVKAQVGQLCNNAEIPFGMTHVEDGEAKIVNSFNCKKNEADRVCIIGSPDAVSLILADHSRGDPRTKYFLFHDEPTIGADNKGSSALEDNVKVMSRLPKWTILSSATMPDIEVLKPFTDKFLNDNKGAVLGTVYSDEITIGCDIRTTEMDRVFPHMGCDTGARLKKIITIVKKNPLLGKIYTHHAAKTIWVECTRNNVPGIPNIPILFKDVNNLSADKVRQCVITMLEILSDQSDEIVTSVCNSRIIDINVKQKVEPKKKKEKVEDSDDDSDDFKFASSSDEEEEDEEEEEDKESPVDYTKLVTEDAHRYLGVNLIATNDPVKFVTENFQGLVDAVKTNEKFPIHNINNVFTRHKADLKAHAAKEKFIDKNVDNEDEKSKQLQEHHSNRPQLRFPTFAQVNTVEHIKKFAGKHAKNVNTRFINPGMALEDIPYDDIAAPDNVKILLFCGVGVYDPTNKVLSKSFNSLVLQKTADKELFCIVSTEAICYGTNYPINRVFVCKDFSDTHSINTLYQLFGRAGRVGKSWKAEIYIDRTCAQAIFEYVKDPESHDTEAHNMIATFNEHVSEQDDDVMRAIEEMKAKLLKASAEKEEPMLKVIHWGPTKKKDMEIVKVSDVIKDPLDNPREKTSGSWRRPRSQPKRQPAPAPAPAPAPKPTSSKMSWRKKSGSKSSVGSNDSSRREDSRQRMRSRNSSDSMVSIGSSDSNSSDKRRGDRRRDTRQTRTNRGPSIRGNSRTSTRSESSGAMSWRKKKKATN